MTEPPPPPYGNYPPPQSGGYQPPPGGFPPPPSGGYPPPPPPSGGYPPPGGYPPSWGAAAYPSQAAPMLPKEAYTPWITRVLAYLIDVIPAAIIGGIGQGIAFGTADNQCVTVGEYDFGASCTSQFTALGTVVFAVSYIVALAYWVWNWGYRQGSTGQSIGKSVMKFKVVSEKTWQPIGFGLSVVRQLAHFVDAIICYIGFLFPLWDAKRQTLADKIMTTVCVPATPAPPQPGSPYGP